MKSQPTKSVELTPLEAFRQRHKITFQQLSDICNGAPDCSKSSIERLAKNQIEVAKTAAGIRRILAKNLPNFLLHSGLSAALIDKELLQIFNEGEYQLMSNPKTVLPKAIQQHFGLKDDPFSKPPKHRNDVFISQPLKEIIDLAIDAIKFQDFIYITGEIGAGKSVLRSTIEDHVLSQSNLRLIFPEAFDMSRVTPANIARAILEEFEVEQIPNDAVSRTKKVKNVLARAYRDGIRVAIAFDECHRMQDSSISTLKNLSEMNSGGFQKYLGIIVIGQPSFKSKLTDPRFREILERITPLEMPSFADYAKEYFAHRLRLAGGNLTDLFDETAIDLICRQAQTPLQLGNIANEALIISKNEFNNKKVVGNAIKTKRNFSAATEPKVHEERKAVRG